MIRSLVVVLAKISPGASRQRPRSPARRPRESDGRVHHEAAAHRHIATPRLSKRLPGRSGPAEPKINRADHDLGQARGA